MYFIINALVRIFNVDVLSCLYSVLHLSELHQFFFRDPCLQKVKRYYKKERAKKGAYLPVEFEEEKISLDIPMPDGVTVSEWKLTPLVPPNVSLTTSSFTKCIQ